MRLRRLFDAANAPPEAFFSLWGFESRRGCVDLALGAEGAEDASGLDSRPDLVVGMSKTRTSSFVKAT